MNRQTLSAVWYGFDTGTVSTFVAQYWIFLYTNTYQNGWRFGVAVTRWSRSKQLLYIEPG